MSLLESLATQGFAEIQLPGDLYDRAIALAERFYRIPLGDRMAVGAFTTRGVLGYYPSEAEASECVRAAHAEIPLFTGGRVRGYSSFDFIGNPKVVGSSELLKRNLWPTVDGGFSYEACSVYSAIGTLSRRLSENLLVSLGPSCDTAIGMFEGDCCSLMRLLRYRESATASYSKPHTDYEFMTITVANAPGLEVRRVNGDWQRLPCATNMAILLPGDMLEMVSGSSVPSTLHRVAFGDAERTAVVFFQGLPLGYEIHSTIAGYSPRTFGDHLLAMLIRGAAHLTSEITDLEKVLGFTIPDKNPFRRYKE